MDLFSVTWGQRKFLWQIISVLSNNPAADSSIGNDLAGTSKYIIILSTQTMHLRTPYLDKIFCSKESRIVDLKF